MCSFIVRSGTEAAAMQKLNYRDQIYLIFCSVLKHLIWGGLAISVLFFQTLKKKHFQQQFSFNQHKFANATQDQNSRCLLPTNYVVSQMSYQILLYVTDSRISEPNLYSNWRQTKTNFQKKAPRTMLRHRRTIVNRPMIYYRLSNTAVGMVMETNLENNNYTPFINHLLRFIFQSISMRMVQHEENRSKASLLVPVQDDLSGYIITAAENQSYKNLIENTKIQIKIRTVKLQNLIVLMISSFHCKATQASVLLNQLNIKDAALQDGLSKTNTLPLLKTRHIPLFTPAFYLFHSHVHSCTGSDTY